MYIHNIFEKLSDSVSVFPNFFAKYRKPDKKENFVYEFTVFVMLPIKLVKNFLSSMSNILNIF